MTRETGDEPLKFVFLLVPNFSLISFASALEPMRLANRVAGRKLFEWRLASETGGPVRCSAGTELSVDMGLAELDRDAMIMVCGGIDIQAAATRPLLTWLRREARRGVGVGGLCTASYIVAKAGLLDGRRTTIHWENRESFAEEFPEVDLSTQIYTLDKDRCSSAGGSASADLSLRIISENFGSSLASQVADLLIYNAPRTEKDEQRLSVPARIGVRHPKLAEVIHTMEVSIEEPLSAAELAEQVGMSTRQLERLFRRYLDRSPKRYYLELRLEKARRLLLQTDMSVINVALACGFTSPSHFSKCYRAHFKHTPYRERGLPSAER